MKILFCGDVVGKSGREVLAQYLPSLKEELNLDIIIVNGENSAHGFGITQGIAEDMFALGVDVITLGNHSFDNPNIMDYITTQPKLIRPLNYVNAAGQGYYILNHKNTKILVINLLGKLFMHSKLETTDPFAHINTFLEEYKLTEDIDAIIVDFHAETTSEKNAMGFFLDGKVSAVLGTHTHMPTADARILPNDTGFQTDVGMCGDYNSVIGMSIESALSTFFLQDSAPKLRLTPALGEGMLAGTLLEIDSMGKCIFIESIKYGKIFKKENQNV
ncbi:MAG: TIGR00282 family metallophosphoesterase [Alphaproteobacteria bacterium]|jgi:metallophosphoesterase (TIGR00282 family)|nr:TIGR00282 family metallophosphoesterase [Alphaproteobacteria bacterium]